MDDARRAQSGRDGDEPGLLTRLWHRIRSALAGEPESKPTPTYSWSNPPEPLTEADIEALVATGDGERIMRAMISADEVTSIRLSIALLLHDNFSCGRGLLIHSRSRSSETYDLMNRIDGNLPSGQFVCNVCRESFNLSEKYLPQRFAAGQIGVHYREEGVGRAKQRIAELERGRAAGGAVDRTGGREG